MSRSKPQKSAARKLLKKPKGKLIPIDLASTNHPEWMTRVYKNNRYIMMIDDNARIKGVAAIKAMVQRHDDKPIPGHWRELQDIKNEIFGSEAMAVEFYPPESELTEVKDLKDISGPYTIEELALDIIATGGSAEYATELVINAGGSAVNVEVVVTAVNGVPYGKQYVCGKTLPRWKKIVRSFLHL